MSKKRGNNEDSLFQRENGAWLAQVSLEGRRLSKTFSTKRAAQAWIRETLNEIDVGLHYKSTLLTIERFFKDWLVSIEPSLRFSTFNQYKQITEQHILPFLGEKKLRELHPRHLQARYNDLHQQGSSPRTIQYVHAVIHRALEQAVKQGHLVRNPDNATIIPKAVDNEMQFFNQAQVNSFLQVAKTTEPRFYALFHLAVTTGMRQGELLALKWSDLYWKNQTLQVQRQLIKKKSGGFEFALPKTKAGIRSIVLGQQTIQSLQTHWEQQQQEKAFQATRWQEEDIIFPSTIGTPMNRDNLRKRFKKVLHQANLPAIRFHDLRHTAASLMLNHRIPVYVVSKRLGHAQASITLDIYGHLMPGKQAEVASLMDQLLVL